MMFLQNHPLSITIITGIFLSSCSQSLTHSLNPSDGEMHEMVQNMDEQLIVDCVPPPRVRAHGGAVFLRRGRPLRTTVLDCRHRGGEYTVNAPRKKRIEIWQAKANDGAVEAQTYLGEIYEKGIDREPDYEFAALWYKKAAAQGSKRAQNNLGFLYEKGLGVPKNPQIALTWYQKAAGSPQLNQPASLNPNFIQELVSLRNEIKQKSLEAEQLHQKLDLAQAKLGQVNNNEQLLAQSENQQTQLQVQNQAYKDRLALLSERITALELERQDASQSEAKQVELSATITLKIQETGELKEHLSASQHQLLQSQLNIAELQQRINTVQTNNSTDIRALKQTIAQLKVQLEENRTILEDDKKKFSAQIWKGVNFGQYHALIIGNNKYKHLSNLRTPINDARRLDNTLTQQYAFNTKLLLNANRADILDALGDYHDALSPEDSLLIFYAGHGTLTDSNGFWLGVDSKSNRKSDWISNNDITEILEQMEARHILLVVDSCYSGSIIRSSIEELKPDMQGSEQLGWIKKKLSLISRTAITSGGIEPVLDGTGKHSVFAHAFMSHLEKNKSILASNSLFQTIAPRVISRAKSIGGDQDPQYARLMASADENGEFYFKPVNITTQADYYHFASLLWATEYVELNP